MQNMKRSSSSCDAILNCSRSRSSTALIRVMVDIASANSCPSIYPRDQRDPFAIHPPKVLIITLYLLLFPFPSTPPNVASRRDYRPATPKPAYLHRACTTRVAPSKLTSTFTCRTRACTCTARKLLQPSATSHSLSHITLPPSTWPTPPLHRTHRTRCLRGPKVCHASFVKRCKPLKKTP